MGYKEIELTQGKVALVSDKDYERVNQYKWFAHRDIKNNRFYARRNITLNNGKQKTERMHRFILGVKDSKIHVDHKSGEGLDNRRENLRESTCSQNQSNRGMTKVNKSGYKGVFGNKDGSRWLAKIKKDKTQYYLGWFDDIKDAAKAYNDKSLELNGEFGYLNIIK